MSTIRQEELHDAAEVASDNGHEETADELSFLAGGEKEYETIAPGANKSLSGVRMSTITPDTNSWLWDGWIPLGCVTIVGGEGGTFKSTLLAKIAADQTRDRLKPDGSKGERGGVIWISLEEQVDSQVLPRLIANDADLDQVWDLHEVKRPIQQLGDPGKTRFMLPDDLAAIEAVTQEMSATLVVIDPMMLAVNPKVSTARGQTAGNLVLQCQAMAERLGIAIVIIWHYTKGTSKDVIQRLGGSKVFTNTVRSIIIVSKDPSDSTRSIMSLKKHSLGGERPDIAFTRAPDGKVEFVTGMNEEQQKAQEVKMMVTTREAIIGLLNAHPERDFTIPEIAQMVRAEYTNVRALLRRMVQSGDILQIERGRYRSMSVAA